MKLMYLNRHAGCPFYIGDSPVGFGVVDAGRDEVLKVSSSFGMVVMLLEGEILVAGDNGTSLNVTSGQMFALPPQDKFTVRVLKPLKALRLYIIGNKLEFCHRVVSEEKIDRTDSPLYAMPILPAVDVFARQMVMYITDKLLCCEIHHLKQKELAALLQGYYRPAVLRRFLAPLYAKDSSFLEKVMTLSTSIFTVEQMAGQLNMSRSTFVRNFSKNFQESPKRWLTDIRTKVLFDTLRDTDLPLEEVAKKLKFSSQQNMNYYCCKNIGATPMQVRNGEVDMPRPVTQKG